MRRYYCLISILAAANLAPGLAVAQEPRVRIFEAYPDEIQARLELRNRRVLSLPALPTGVQPFSLVVEDALKWRAGQTITVAFSGGDPNLHRQIADAASIWMNHANLTLDFGYNPSSGRYRAWSASDRSYAADIRISFSYAGYWSLVGTDSKNVEIAPPSTPSMNFGGFLFQLPDDWQETVLHEFGHAFGLHHEHQHPTEGCDEEWRWEDDPGYVQTTNQFGQFIPDTAGRQPGLYTVLAGEPNRWPKSKVDHNLRQLSNSQAYSFGSFDPSSIMKYFFDEWMFKRGSRSQCFTPSDNTQLSAMDEARIAEIYPSAAGAIGALVQARSQRAEVLRALLKEVPIPLRPDVEQAADFLSVESVE